MDLNLVLRFLHILFGVITVGGLLSAWLWSMSLPREARGEGLGQLRFWARHGPLMAQLAFVVPISGLILVFTKSGGSFSGWLWLTIVFYIVYMLSGIAVVGPAGTRLLKSLEAAPQVKGFSDVRSEVIRVQLGYGVMLLVTIISVFLMVYQPF